MGEGKKLLFEPSFNRAVKVRGGQDRLTSDAGTLLLREADHRLGLTQSLRVETGTQLVPVAEIANTSPDYSEKREFLGLLGRLSC